MLRSVLVFSISAMFIGLGLGRFAFSPLVPELVGGGWLDVRAAQSVAAANLVGYFLGALLATPVLRLVTARRLCIASGALVVLSYAMFLVPLGVPWFWTARLLAGAGGSILMVVATAAAGRRLAALDRRRFQPLVFLGIGLGALFAALCLPQLLRFGIGTSILALLIFSALALVVLWLNSRFMMSEGEPAPVGRGMFPPGGTVVLIILAYGCDALGFVMHTVYLPDMLRRIAGQTEAQVGLGWAMFGIGACVGPAFVMMLRRWLSTLDALWVALALKAAGIALVIASTGPLVAGVSLFIVGMLTPGSVILTSGALAASAPPERYLGLWAVATALFALCQMASGVAIAAISGQGYATALILSVAVTAFGAVLALTSRLLLRTV